MNTFKPGDLVFHLDNLIDGDRIVGIVVKVCGESGAVQVSFADTIKPETYACDLNLCDDIINGTANLGF